MSEEKAQYTPGKWAFSRVYSESRRVGFAISIGNPASPTGNTRIATVWDYMKGLVGPKDAETEANARLIAAAPALYEALKAIIECIPLSVYECPDHYPVRPLLTVKEAKTAKAALDAVEMG